MTGNQIALSILMNPRLTEKQRDAKLKAAAKKLKDQLENRVECPECDDQGPHDDNGARGSELSYCCRKCGTHFDADQVR